MTDGDFLFILCIIIIKNTCVISKRDSREINLNIDSLRVKTSIIYCQLMRARHNYRQKIYMPLLKKSNADQTICIGLLVAL